MKYYLLLLAFTTNLFAATSNSCEPIFDPQSCKMPGARCRSECSLSMHQMRIIRYVIGQPLDRNGIDDNFREALAYYMWQKKLPSTSGDLDRFTIEYFKKYTAENFSKNDWTQSQSNERNCATN